MITFITYCHVLFLSISLIYLYPLSMHFPRWSFRQTKRERTRARTCIEQASKYNKWLSGINYRTRTFELRPGEHRRGGGHRQGWLSIIPATCHKLSHWPYMALATDSARVTFALRNLNSDAETILIFDTRETAGQDGSLIWVSYLGPFITYRRELRNKTIALTGVEFILYTRICACNRLYQMEEKYIVRNMYFLRILINQFDDMNIFITIDKSSL